MIGIYSRISREKDGNDLSIQDQKQKGEAVAKRLNLPFTHYTDEGVSGGDNIEDRPEFFNLIEDVKKKKLTHVFVFDQSRLERNPSVRFIITDLFIKNNITLITETGGVVDLNNSETKFFGDIMSVINNYQITQTKVRVKSALKMKAGQGKAIGVLPYGYDKDDSGNIIIDEPKRNIIEKVYELSLQGVGCRTIAKQMNDLNIPTKFAELKEGYGKGTIIKKNKATGVTITYDKAQTKWSITTVQNIIKNPFYKGVRNYGGNVYDVPPIIEPEYWKKVNENLTNNRNAPSPTAKHDFLLRGVLKCGICGGSMYGIRKPSKNENYYKCSNKFHGKSCENKSINITKIDNFIWDVLFVKNNIVEKVKNELTFDTTSYELYTNKIDTLNNEVEELKNERKKAIGLVIKGVINEDDISEVLSEIDGKINLKSDDITTYQTKLDLISKQKEIITTYQNEVDRVKDVKDFTKRTKIIKDFISEVKVYFSQPSKKYFIDIIYNIKLNHDIWNVKPVVENKEFNDTIRNNDYFLTEIDNDGTYSVYLSDNLIDSKPHTSKPYELDVDIPAPNTDLNTNGTLFGGQLLAWIDEEAALYSIVQLENPKVVTKYMSEIKFMSAAKQGDIVEIGIDVVKFGSSSLVLKCEVRNMMTREKIITIDNITMVNLDEDGKSKPHGKTQIEFIEDRLGNSI